MKKIGMLAVLMAVLLTASAAKAQNYGMAGCGLGSFLFGNQNTVLFQVLAATTNGFFWNQTFSITTGTSNCTSAGIIKAEREQAAFAEVNFQDLKRNMASGGGEFLTSFSTLLGCEEQAKPALFKMTQEKYATILPSEKSGPLDLVAGVKVAIRADPRLANACSDERAIARASGQKPPGSLALAR